MTEQWRAVIGHEECYSVSNYGRVRRDKAYRSTYSGRLLSCTPGMSGYPVVKIYAHSKFRLRKVHQLVAEAFIGECPEGRQVNHKDGNKRNNRVDNLEYVTNSQNIRHSFDMGLQHVPRGERHPFAKLTVQRVKAIRAEYVKGATSHEKLARRYGVSRGTMSDLLCKRTWKDV